MRVCLMRACSLSTSHSKITWEQFCFSFPGSLYHQLTGLTRNAFRSHELDVGGNAPPCERRASVEAECVRSETAQKGASNAVRRKCPLCGSPFAQNKCAVIVLAFCSLLFVPYLGSSTQSSRRWTFDRLVSRRARVYVCVYVWDKREGRGF